MCEIRKPECTIGRRRGDRECSTGGGFGGGGDGDGDDGVDGGDPVRENVGDVSDNQSPDENRGDDGGTNWRRRRRR
jgi:hypothetical protein